MSGRKTGRPVGRPIDPSLEGRILDAGWHLFLARGVDAVAVELIAHRAEVSKATFYKYFADKGALFEAAVLREMQRIEIAQQHGLDADASLEVQLTHFGVGLMTFLMRQEAVDFYKALAGELSRHPTLACRFYDLGPGRTRASLAAIIASAANRGELIVSEPEVAAEQLIGLWQGITNFQLSLGINTETIRAGIPQRVLSGVQIFLSAYSREQRSAT